MEQAQDFLDESEALAAILVDLPRQDFDRATQFKGWTINDVLVHLHFWNKAADLSLTDQDAFQAMMAKMMASISGTGLRPVENEAIVERGFDLVTNWRALYQDMGARWSKLDPKQRVKWAGPDMSVRSSMTARQMETWAHGHEVFDLLGIRRTEDDRIRNIVVLGVNTYGWSFKVRGKEATEPIPELKLIAPSGVQWEISEPSQSECIEGSAVEFAQVVTQTRSIGDTNLKITGPVASEWMANAQCFAGPAETPPAPGSRHLSG